MDNDRFWRVLRIGENREYRTFKDFDDYMSARRYYLNMIRNDQSKKRKARSYSIILFEDDNETELETYRPPR